jgi:hypothetical protein
VAAVGLGNGVALLAQAVGRWALPRTVLAVAVAGFVLAAVATTAVEMVTTAKETMLGGRRTAETVFSQLPDDATVMTVEVPQPLALTSHRSISRYLLYTAGINRWIDDHYPGGLAGYVAWVRKQEADVLFTKPGPMPHPFETLESDYYPVGTTGGWRAWVHVGVDKEVRKRVDRALSRERRERAGQ